MKTVIVGGGFCGATIAKKLDCPELTLIDKKSFFEYTPSITKTSLDGEYKENIIIPYREFLRESRILEEEVTEITPEKVITNHEKIPYDRLIISTGSTYPIMLDDKENVFTLDNLENSLRINKKIQKAKKILVVGGGFIGTELAGELATKTDKKITLVHSKKTLLERNPRKAGEYAKKFLEGKGVEVLLGKKITEHKGNTFNGDIELKADLCVWSAGISWNPPKMNGFGKVCNAKGQLMVDEFLRLKNHENVFVGGDANDIDEEKTAQNAEHQAYSITDSMTHELKGEKLVPYQKKKRPLVISLGDSHGIITYRNHALTGRIPGITKHLVQYYTLSGFNGIVSKVKR